MEVGGSESAAPLAVRQIVTGRGASRARARIRRYEELLAACVVATKNAQEYTGQFDGEAVRFNLQLKLKIARLRERLGHGPDADGRADIAALERFQSTLAPDWNRRLIEAARSGRHPALRPSSGADR